MSDDGRGADFLMGLFLAVHLLLPGMLLASVAYDLLASQGPAALLLSAGHVIAAMFPMFLFAALLLGAYGLVLLALAPSRA